MERIGVVGLGIMGTAYARNLLDAGYEVVGYDISVDRLRAHTASGVDAARSPAAVAERCEAVITALPSVKALEDVVADIAASSHQGLTVAEMSTLPLAAKESARSQLERIGAVMVDAPVSGTGLQAAAADIVVYASGNAGGLEKMSPVFDVLGKRTFDLGAFGNGSKMKFLANLLVSVHNLATAEAFVLGMKAGLDPQRILEVLSAGVGSSRILEIRGPMMVADQYEPAAAKLEMFIKDVDVIASFGRDLGVETPLLDRAGQVYEEAVAAGLGDLDAAALCRLLEARAGITR